MAYLDQVIGALLRDLARARAMADRYSRDLSGLYERDPILRLFPVPRIDIRHTTIDLRLAINAVTATPAPDREEPSIAHSDRILRIAAEMLLSGFVKEILSANPPPDVNKALRDKGFHEAAIAAVFQALTKLAPKLSRMDSNPAIYEKLATDLANQLFRIGTQANSEINTFINAHGDLEKRVIGISAKCLATLNVQAAGWQQADDQLELNQRVEIEIESEKLRQLPDSAVSTLHLELEVTNYNWTSVGENNLETAQRLTPE